MIVISDIMVIQTIMIIKSKIPVSLQVVTHMNSIMLFREEDQLI
jgi:hypothetical protein